MKKLFEVKTLLIFDLFSFHVINVLLILPY